jgi:integrase
LPTKSASRSIDRHNLLHRHLKKAAKKLGLPDGVDFRSFRTMHASLMRRVGGRLEVARDNMGHASSTGSITLDVYSKTWWEERVDAVTAAVFTEPEEKEKKTIATPLKDLPDGGNGKDWEPFWNPRV